MAAAFLVCLGVTFIYAGYRLFCDLPALSERRNRVYIMLTNVLPGVVFALIGASLLTTQAVGVVRHRHPAKQGISQPTSGRPARQNGATLVG